MFSFVPYSIDKIYSNSYITVEELKEINDKDVVVNYNDISQFTDEQLENQLINASKILDTLFSYADKKLNENQNLEFPRHFEKELSNDIKIATAYISSFIANDKLDNILIKKDIQQVKSEKADVLQKDYYENTKINQVLAKNPYLENLLKKYLGGSFIINTYRA